MIEEMARVSRCEEDYAIVEVTRTSSCNSCNAKGACGTGSLALWFRFRPPPLKVLNSLNARPGDQVMVALEESRFLTGSFLLYMLPLLSLFAFALLFEWLAQISSIANPEAAAISGALSGLVAGLLGVRYLAITVFSSADSARLLKVIQPSVSISQLDV